MNVLCEMKVGLNSYKKLIIPKEELELIIDYTKIISFKLPPNFNLT